MGDRPSSGFATLKRARPTFETIFLRNAFDLAERSTCRRLNVGCVVLTHDFRRTLSFGYNGNAHGLENDCDSDEPGKCGCIHAEANAVVKCADHHARKVVVCTDSPCVACAKLLIQLGGVERVVYNREYRIRDGLALLERLGIRVERVDFTPRSP